MNVKPICRLCFSCGLALAVVAAEEHEHVHVESQVSPTFWRAANVPVATTSSAVSVPSSVRPPRV